MERTLLLDTEKMATIFIEKGVASTPSFKKGDNKVGWLGETSIFPPKKQPKNGIHNVPPSPGAQRSAPGAPGAQAPGAATGRAQPRQRLRHGPTAPGIAI